MTSPKGGKNKLTRHSPVKKILKGKGAANDKGKKRNMTRKDIADYLEWAVFEKESPKKASPIKVLPIKPRLPLTKREKEILKVEKEKVEKEKAKKRNVTHEDIAGYLEWVVFEKEKAKGKKRNMTREDIADYLEWVVFERELLKVVNSINKLGL